MHLLKLSIEGLIKPKLDACSATICCIIASGMLLKLVFSAKDFLNAHNIEIRRILFVSKILDGHYKNKLAKFLEFDLLRITGNLKRDSF